MPPSLDDVKTSLLNELWLPLAIRGSHQIFPHRKNHKKMKLFTLTAMHHQEVEAFEDSKLTKREDVVAWHHSYQQSLRLETDLGPSKVLHEGRFDDAIISDGSEISKDLLCDILNLDFLSQQPIVCAIGRIEREINGEAILIRALSASQGSGFILFYTTLLDKLDLCSDNLSFSFNLPLGFSNPVQSIDNKIEFIRIALNSILRNYRYDVSETKDLTIDFDSDSKVFSIGFIVSRST
jgi:hypothetical protein